MIVIIGRDPWVYITLVTKFDSNQVQKNEQINKSIIIIITNRKSETIKTDKTTKISQLLNA